jgi:hypothetical protein
MTLSASFKTLSGKETIASIGGEPAIRNELGSPESKVFFASYADPNSTSPIEEAQKRCAHLAPNVASLFQNLFSPLEMFFNSK